jgi:hypothetical protein
MARPTKRTNETQEKLFEALREGSTRRAACAHAGICEDTLANWLKSFSGFSDRLTREEGLAEKAMADALFRSAKTGDWRAAESWLKRRRPAEWGDKATAEITGPGGGPMQIAFTESLDRVFGEEPDGGKPGA